MYTSPTPPPSNNSSFPQIHCTQHHPCIPTHQVSKPLTPGTYFVEANTYVLARIPRLAIGAASRLRRAVSPLVVGVAAFGQLGVVGGEVLVVVETLLGVGVLVGGWE